MTDEKEEFPFALTDDLGPTQHDARPFSSEQMVACASCARANPPTRMNCLYCGSTLPTTDASAALRRPVLKPLEDWERGFNVVLLPSPRRGREVDATTLRDAAALLRIEAASLREIIVADDALPVARTAFAEEAALIERRLAALNFNVETLSDDALAVEAPLPRVRKIEWSRAALEGWTVGRDEPLEIEWPNVLLFVAGRIWTKRVEVEERRASLRRGAEVADARELFTDEAVLDVFAAGKAADVAGGWRISAGNFDYSCLGEHKGLLARDNFVRLIKTLRERAPGARFDDDYGRVRQLLDPAWPPAERTTSGGLRRERPGRLNAEAVTIITNEAQFSRYARLRCRHELRRRAAPPKR